jgi:hypothetical protein
MTNGNGHIANGHDGHGGPDVVTKASPYVTRRRRLEEIAPDGDIQIELPNEAVDQSVLAEDGKAKSDRGRRLGFAAFLIVVVVGVGIALYLKFGYTTKIDYVVKGKQKTSTMLQQPGQQQSGQQAGGEENNTQVEAAIAQMKEARRGAADDAAVAVESNAPEISAATPSIPRLSLPSDYASPPRPARSEGGGGGYSAAGYTGGGQVTPQRSQRGTTGQSKMASLYADDAKEKTSSVPMPPTTTAVTRNTLPTLDAKPIPLPVFGSKLPMRTRGGLITLRNSIVMLELTRDVSGDGWALKKGTVFVGQMQGGAYDRAYLSVSGFIDPATNKVVKLTGEVLGDDATAGLKGKRRQMTSRWARALNYSLQVAPGLVQAALARSGGTTVIVPVGGSASELLPSGNTDRREFVEVEAGATGYILVTDLPNQIKGVDADPTEYLAEASGPKVAQGELSDSELAELLANGTPEKIREAMPRMNPEMRRIAALAIGGK